MKRIMIYAAMVSSMLFMYVWVDMAFSDEAYSAHVTLIETYGLNTKKEGGKYRVICFVPRTFLLFDVDYQEPDLKVGEQFLAATTQDGVRMYLLERAVSKGKFSDVFGRQDIIFNKSHAICLDIQCDLSDDDQLLKINAGEVFVKKEMVVAGHTLYELVGDRGNRALPDIIKGYISEEELEELNTKGVITHATLKHPRYQLEVKEGMVVNTACGVTITKNDEKVVQSIGIIDKEIIEAFDLAEIGGDGDLLRFGKSYGGDNKEVAFKLYNVTDQRTEPVKTEKYAAQIIFRCRDEGILNERTFIESVTIKNIGTGKAKIFTPFGTPEDLLEYTGAPYMYSVNSSQHYFDLMDRLSKHFESRALAGYFLAGFNRSCKGTFRKKVKNCQHKGYAEISNQ